MSGSTSPRAVLLPNQTIPANPNSSFAANFTLARRQLASLCSISFACPTEEMEENEICQPKSTVKIVVEQRFRLDLRELSPRLNQSPPDSVYQMEDPHTWVGLGRCASLS
jgi:hypothetical protein